MKIYTLDQNKLVKIDKFLSESSLTMGASREDALSKLSKFNVKEYAKTRNSLDGAVSKLSVYVEHGLLNINDFLLHINATSSQDCAEPLLKQIYWREFFLQTYEEDRTKIWQDYEEYKTGYSASDYAQVLPQDIQEARTGVELIDKLVEELETSRYLHNHARLYLASYIVHFRKVKWQVGAKWMLLRLNDANIALNNLSWQWVASTRSNKPYIFNWQNIEIFAAKKYNLLKEDHEIFDASYEELSKRLFLQERSDV